MSATRPGPRVCPWCAAAWRRTTAGACAACGADLPDLGGALSSPARGYLSAAAGRAPVLHGRRGTGRQVALVTAAAAVFATLVIGLALVERASTTPASPLGAGACCIGAAPTAFVPPVLRVTVSLDGAVKLQAEAQSMSLPVTTCDDAARSPQAVLSTLAEVVLRDARGRRGTLHVSAAAAPPSVGASTAGVHAVLVLLQPGGGSTTAEGDGTMTLQPGGAGMVRFAALPPSGGGPAISGAVDWTCALP